MAELFTEEDVRALAIKCWTATWGEEPDDDESLRISQGYVWAILSALAEDGRLVGPHLRRCPSCGEQGFGPMNAEQLDTFLAAESGGALPSDTPALADGWHSFEEFAVEDVDPDGWPRTEPLFSRSVAEVWLKNWQRDGSQGRIVRRVTHQGPWEPVTDPVSVLEEETPGDQMG